MKHRAILVVFLLVLVFSANGQNPERAVSRNVLSSAAFPKIKVRVNGNFKYVGKFGFVIPKMANGQRYVFVDADKNKRVKRLFIFQFEEILKESSEIYRYSFANARKIGSHLFRHNTFAYGNREARRENPHGEGVLTEDFLVKMGYTVEDELMASRFLTVPDAEKKHEMIMFYIENVGETNHLLSDLYHNDERTEIWERIAASLTARSELAFTISD